MTTVPRTPATAFGILMLMTSPGCIRSRATLRAIFPDSTSMVERPGTSVIVTAERSRMLTTALPPSRRRANDCSPVTTRSWRKTSSLNFRGDRLRRDRAHGRHVALERRDDTGLRGLRERRRGQQIDGESEPCERRSSPSTHQ